MSTQWRTWFNPSHKLYEPWVRVSWAEHKMATFGLATNIAVHDTAYRFVPDVNHDSQSRGVLTFRCEKVPHLTMEARFLLGELVFHLRVALDHIACALVEEGGGTVTECTGFPIPKLEFSETSGISIKNREVERSIKGASPEAIVAVKNLQPDIDRNTNHFNPAIALAILHEMSISDKHIQTLSLEPQVLVSHARTGKTIFNHLKVDQDGRVDVPQATGDRLVFQEHQDIRLFHDFSVNTELGVNLMSGWHLQGGLVQIYDFVIDEVFERLSPLFK